MNRLRIPLAFLVASIYGAYLYSGALIVFFGALHLNLDAVQKGLGMVLLAIIIQGVVDRLSIYRFNRAFMEFLLQK